MKAKYIIKELQNVNSERAGYTYTGTLTAAKRYASRNQVFQGTVLRIENEYGDVIAVKQNGHWGKAYITRCL